MKSNPIALGAVTALVLLASQPAAAIDIVYNGGFELPGVAVGGTLTVPAGAAVGGWQFLGGNGGHYLGLVGGGGPVRTRAITTCI